MRRVLFGVSVLVVCATCAAAPLDVAVPSEDLPPAALRPSLPPESDNPAKAENGLHSGAGFLSYAIFARAESDCLRERGRFDAPDAPRPGSAPATFAKLSFPIASAPDRAWTPPAEEALEQQAGADFLSQYGYAASLARAPAWLGALEVIDVLRRQDALRWRLQDAWTSKGGWELDLAPTRETLVYARDFYSSSAQKRLTEVMAGLAAPAGYSLWQPFGKLYFGPFMSIYGFRFDQEAKVGAHLTLSEIGAFHLTFAGGYAHDRFKGAGAFGLIETSRRF